MAGGNACNERTLVATTGLGTVSGMPENDRDDRQMSANHGAGDRPPGSWHLRFRTATGGCGNRRGSAPVGPRPRPRATATQSVPSLHDCCRFGVRFGCGKSLRRLEATGPSVVRPEGIRLGGLFSVLGHNNHATNNAHGGPRAHENTKTRKRNSSRFREEWARDTLPGGIRKCYQNRHRLSSHPNATQPPRAPVHNGPWCLWTVST